MKKIYLTTGEYALVDDCDFDKVSQFRWMHSGAGYAVTIRMIGTKHVRMHRMILDAEPGQIIDHKDGNKLDNRRSNIRFCTSQQNQANMGKPITNSSGYKGVYRNKKDGLWYVRISVGNKRIWVGCFKDVRKAAIAYNEAALMYHGEFARLNQF